MNYILSKKYEGDEWMSKIMGPNPVKLTEELMAGWPLRHGARVCDLGSGQGLTSVFLAKEYGLEVWAADLWSDPEENRAFFRRAGLTEKQIHPVKADAQNLPFERDFFDGVVCVDSTPTSAATRGIWTKSCCPSCGRADGSASPCRAW